MEMNNDIDGDAIMDAADSPQLSYATPKEQNNHVSKAADPKDNTMEQHVSIKGPALNAPSTSKLPRVDNVINYHMILMALRNPIYEMEVSILSPFTDPLNI